LISEFLLCQVKETKSNSKNPQYRIRTTSLAGNINLKNYLVHYPLFSSKYLDFKDWIEILNYFQNKEHKIKYNEIIKIKSCMNDKRTFFC
jgi:UDP-N-acetylmuramoylalanine-D-glutamate ligase